MIYITKKQYEKLKVFFAYKKLNITYDDAETQSLSDTDVYNTTDNSVCEVLAFTLSEKHSFYVLKKVYDNLVIFELEGRDESIARFLQCLGIYKMKKIEHQMLREFLNSNNNIEFLIKDTLEAVLGYFKTQCPFYLYLEFNEHIVIKLTTDIILHKTEIDQYYSGFTRIKDACAIDMELYGIFCDKDLYEDIYASFDLISYLYEQRIFNKPSIVAEGNGYIFFDIGSYILGRQKFYGCADTPTSFYLLEKDSYKIILICEDDSKETRKTILRNAQSFVAYLNIKNKGLNLHASSLVYKKQKAIVLLGEKMAGKTTNLLFGLKSSEHTDFQSNDLAFLNCKNGIIYVSGSNRKVTVRKDTVPLFDEFSGYCIADDEYSSKGSKNLNGSYSIVMGVDKLAAIFRKKIIPHCELGAFVLIQYDIDVQDVMISELTDRQKEDILMKNMHTFYNGLEPFWNELFQHQGIIRVEPFLKVPMFCAHVNKDNIYDTWRRLFSEIDAMN